MGSINVDLSNGGGARRMCVSVQRTVIEEGRVEMVVAVQATRDGAIVWIQFSIPVDVDLARPVAEVRLEALLMLRNILSTVIRNYGGVLRFGNFRA